MRYKVGDKVKVRSDLKENISYKGLGYAYGVNGKTTAYSNGICGNYGSRQDWGM